MYRVAFDIGDTVRLKTDPEKLQRIVTGICIRKGLHSFDLAQNNNSSWHYDFEIESDVKKTIVVGFKTNKSK